MRTPLHSYLRASVAFFALCTALGVVLRVSYLRPLEGLNFAFALHAHSHTLFFGWAALALLTLLFDRVGARDGAVRTVLAAVVALSLATFVAFLSGGYSLPGIVVSALSLPVWCAAALLFFRRSAGHKGTDVAFMRVGVWYLALSGIPALGRVVLKAVGVTDPIAGQLAVFGFLHLFTSFFIFSVLGALIGRLKDSGALFDELRLREVLRWLAALAWLTFPLGVAGASGTLVGKVAVVGALALVAPAVLLAAELIRASGGLRESKAVRALVALWLLKMAMEVAGALGLSELATQLRQPAVLYLHLVLLGFVSGALILLLRWEEGPGAGFWVHQAAGALMFAGLFLVSAGMMFAANPAAPELVRVGFSAAALAGALVVCAIPLWAAPLFLSRRRVARLVLQGSAA